MTAATRDDIIRLIKKEQRACAREMRDLQGGVDGAFKLSRLNARYDELRDLLNAIKHMERATK